MVIRGTETVQCFVISLVPLHVGMLCAYISSKTPTTPQIYLTRSVQDLVCIIDDRNHAVEDHPAYFKVSLETKSKFYVLNHNTNTANNMCTDVEHLDKPYLKNRSNIRFICQVPLQDGQCTFFSVV